MTKPRSKDFRPKMLSSVFAYGRGMGESIHGQATIGSALKRRVGLQRGTLLPLATAALIGVAPMSSVNAQGLPAAQDSDANQGNADIVVTARQAELFKPSTASSATGFSLNLNELPQSVSVITSDFLDVAGVTKLDDVFKYVAGVANEGPQGLGRLESNLVARGRLIDSNRNFKLNGYTFFNLGQIDLTGVERIEFPKGPLPSYSGFGSYGGIVNIITSQPSRKWAASATLTAGSYGLKRIDGDVTAPITSDGSLRTRLSAGYEEGGEFRSGKDRRSVTVVPSIVYDAGPGTELSVLGYYQDLRGQTDSGVPYLSTDTNKNGQYDDGEPFFVPSALPRSTFLGDPRDDYNRATAEVQSIVGRIKQAVGDRTEVNLVASYLKSKSTIRSVYAYTYAPVPLGSNGLVGADSLVEERSATAFVTELSILHKFEAFGQEQQIYMLGGYDKRTTDFYSTGNCVDSVLNIFNVNFSSINIPFPTRQEYDAGNVCYGNAYRERLTDYNIGGQLLLKVTPKLTFLIGARHDWLQRFRIYNDSPANGGPFVNGFVLVDKTQTELSYRLSALYQVADKVNIYAHYARGFTPQLAQVRGGGVIGNEHGAQYEIGAKSELLNGKLAINISVFQLDVSDTAIADPSNTVGQSFSVPGGRERFRGGELEIIGQLNKSLSISANYAYVESSIKASSRPDLIGKSTVVGPNNKASLLIDYAFRDISPFVDRFSFGGALSYVGKQRQNINVEFGVPSYLTADFHAAFAVTKNLSARLNISNVFDKTYFQPGGSTIYDYLVFFGQPRAFTASLTAKF